MLKPKKIISTNLPLWYTWHRKSRLKNSSDREEVLFTWECPSVPTSHLQRVSEKGWALLPLPLESVAVSCHLSLHACNRSLFASGLSIDSCVYVISQHARWPIRTPRPTCANQDAWVVITPRRPKASSIHTAWTQTPFRNIVQRALFYLIHFPASVTRLWTSCHFDFGG